MMKSGEKASPIIQRIRAELTNNADEATKKSFQRFFKEEVTCYGVKTGLVGKIAKKYWEEIKGLNKQEIFGLCEELYASGFCEEAFIVAYWVPNLADRFEPDDLAIFKSWIEKYVDNWAKCDGFCNHTIGGFIEKYPQYVGELKNWARAGHRWLRRAAAVSLIIPAREGRFLTDIFEIAGILISDNDDMVQKGYGWMLKEAGRLHQEEVFNYVAANKKIMPRTALRYAIELMPKDLKSRAMARDC